MKKIIIVIFIISISAFPLSSKLLINEVVTATGSDWVELYFQSSKKESIDISGLYVTMYYGRNENLAAEPVTLYSYNRIETSYDDRFAVIHLTEPRMEDESDEKGDLNGNGVLDLYCNNYYNSLWNSEGVVAVDTDDDPSNGGVIDFVAYSNRDGSPNKSIESYIDYAVSFNEWTQCSSGNPQNCSVDTGDSGLKEYMSISRVSGNDTNSMNDFVITNFQTPGRENIVNVKRSRRRLFRCLRNKISLFPSKSSSLSGRVPLFVYESCNIKFRIFSVNGMKVYEEPLYRYVKPGYFSLKWAPFAGNSFRPTGLYIGRIEAVSRERSISDSKSIILILSRRK